MRVGLDARWIFPHISGIGSHTRELITHLAALDANDDEYVLFFSDESVMRTLMESPALQDNPRFRALLIAYSPFSPKSQLLLPGVIKRQRLDVFHSTNWMIPFGAFPRHRTGRTRCVITIHDMIPLKFPHFTPRALKTRMLPLFRLLLREVAARADRIITVSECSKQDVTELMHLPPERVLVIPNGVDRRYVPGPPVTQRPPVILYVGRLDPYKNVDALLRAFSRVLHAVPQARLQIAGPPDHRYPETLALLDELDLQARVDWTGYLSDDELLKAYQQARVTALPSRYEGFGLPVVEAMACGTPVVCSNAASLPEVAGDNALLVGPDDVQGLAQALQQVLTDDALAQKLAQNGPAQAARFDWKHVAQQTRACYHFA
jgi:alpha-1,3-rhamnosyl/mannosyltransferase